LGRLSGLPSATGVFYEKPAILTGKGCERAAKPSRFSLSQN
jgi:hypothetical protein